MKTTVIIALVVNTFLTTYLLLDNNEKSKQINQLEKKMLTEEQYVLNQILLTQNSHIRLQKQVQSLAKQDGEILDIIGMLNKQIRY